MNQKINKNITIFEKYKININESNLFDLRLEEIFFQIICSLIKYQNYKNYNHLISIIDELELENIDISNILLDSYKEVLNIDNAFLKQYIIKKDTDLLEKDKINFYYILFKYFLKDQIYIYQNLIIKKKIMKDWILYYHFLLIKNIFLQLTKKNYLN